MYKFKIISSLIIYVLCFVGCKSAEVSSVTNAQNDPQICASIDTFTKERLSENPNLNGANIFESKKENEQRILEDLIKTYWLAKIHSRQSVTTEISTYVPNLVDKARFDSEKICKESSKQTVEGAPKHYADLKSDVEFQNAISFYCQQRAKIGDNCVFSLSDSAICAAIGADKPQWITDSCEVNEQLMAKTITQLAFEGCNILARTVVKSDAMNKNCELPILQSICFAHYSSGKDLVAHLNTLGDGKPLDEVAIDRVTATFRSALAMCIGTVAHRNLVGILKNANLSKLTPAQNAAKFLLSREAANDAIYDLKSTPRTKSLGRRVTTQMALTLCSATAQSLAASIDAAPTKSYENACGKRTAKEQKARTASCLRTGADICSSTTGIVDFAGIYAEFDAKNKPGIALSSALEFASLSAGQICSLGGETSSLACGAISSASKEIVRTLRDGNNSWSECLGLAKGGACIGQSFVEWLSGISSETLDAPISTPIKVGEDEIRACCQCQKIYYSDGWLSDTKFRRDSLLMGVTSLVNQGLDQSSCTFYENGYRFIDGATRKGENVYFQHQGCRQVLLKNAPSCQSAPSEFGKKMPQVSYDGMPISGRENFFGPAKVYIGTEVCLDNDC